MGRNGQKMAIAKSVRDLEVYRLAFDTAMEIHNMSEHPTSHVQRNVSRIYNGPDKGGYWEVSA